ncbi:MAG TPA: Gfo/Idh/MocA family oxidoreductase, partial [Anaerolineales bacterium]|nr:Gfo/Idh/MocA family oxidoreductase [Anaerolineales bacterium]
MRPYRAALIGCGKIGSEFADDPLMKGDVFTHAEAYAVCPETTLLGICDTHPDKLRQCGQRWQVKAQFFSALAMMDEVQPELVSICTPDDTHYHVISQILAANHKPLGILCEKPLAMDLTQAQELLEMCKRCGVVLSVNYMRRFAQNINALRMYLLEGNLGEIQAVNGYYTKGVKHNGSHWFDLLRFLVGEVEWVLGMNTLQETGLDPTLDVFLGLQNGALASLRAIR